MSQLALVVLACFLAISSSTLFTNEEEQSMVQCPYSSCQRPLTCSENNCPPGLFCKEDHCECGKVYPSNLIHCNGSRSFVLKYTCVTFHEDTQLTSVGVCIRALNRTKSRGNLASDTTYHLLPGNVSQLDDMMCRPFNRTGKLCGRCLPDHYSLAYSFNMNCIPCPHVHWNWFWYILAAYLPLTLFYLLILYFKINTTTSHLFAVVYCCQTLTIPVNVRNIFNEIEYDTNSHSFTVIVAKLLCSLYGIWNLDFFRPFYSNLCLGIGILPTLTLDYVIAVYPLLLILISYLLIVLHNLNFRVVRILWRPFYALFSLFRRNWDIRTSVIDAFATFFFLSNGKFLSASFDLLIPTPVYQLYPDHYNYTLGLYYAADVEYFGSEHLPYGILAIVMLCVFVILPCTVLALYPFAFFQKFLNLFPFPWYILHTIVDSFYGCYKDGTQPGTRDYRWCLSIFFTFRLCQFLLYAIPDKIVYSLIYLLIQVVLITLMAVVQPFKSFPHNTITIIFLQLNVFISVATLSVPVTVIIAPDYLYFFYVLGIIACAVPLLYFKASSLYWVYAHRRFGLNAFLRVKAWRQGYTRILSASTESLPDRIENSGEYHRENLSNFIISQ